MGYPRNMPRRNALLRLRSFASAGAGSGSTRATPGNGFFRPLGWLGALACFGMGLMTAACAGDQRRAVVPPETEQRSEELYGRQQRSMDSFNQTPSEQAGERHEQHTRPVRPVEEER